MYIDLTFVLWVLGMLLGGYIGGYLGTYVANKENEQYRKELQGVYTASDELNEATKSLKRTLESRKEFYSNFK